MTTTPALMPAEVRELVAITELSWETRAQSAVAFMQKLGSANPHSDAEELMYVICEIPAIRATLERYAELAESMPEWQPGRWWRVISPVDGSLWCETSDEDEARAAARKTGWPLERQWFAETDEWRPVGSA